jgi:hypothetical protein
MKDSTFLTLTPLTPKADRSNPKVRLFEEAILRLRGRWPATATGLCSEVNGLFGFGLGGKAARGELIESRVDEALQLVEALYGSDAVEEVRRSARRTSQPIPA